MIHLPNALIIVGTNRNAGKTTLAEKIIRHFSPANRITGIKISPHFHELEAHDEIVVKTNDFVIVKETRPGTKKDSSRMLTAGAAEVYYIQVWDKNIQRAFEHLLSHIDKSTPMVCESGWLRNVVEPGAFLIVNRKNNREYKESIVWYKKVADRWIEFDGEAFDLDPGELILTDNSWSVMSSRARKE